MKTFNPRPALIAKIHIAKKQLAMDDGAYRAALKQAMGRETCQGASVRQLERAVEYLKSKGFQPTKAKPRPQAAKIKALWHELHNLGALDVDKTGKGKALRRFCKNQTGVDAPEFLSPGQAQKIIEALKAWLKREEKKQKQAAANV